MSGYGPPDDVPGYQMLVARVREGLAAMPPHEAVDRDESTKVIVVDATGTDAGAAAEATGGVPTSASPAAERRRAMAVSAPAPER
jgi:hypothetical protein